MSNFWIYLTHLTKALLNQRRTLLSLGGLVLIVLSSTQSVSAHQCRLYTNDQRNLCLIRNEGQVHYCRYVQDTDLNTYCYALAYFNPKRCQVIQDAAMKTKCVKEVTERLNERIARQKEAAALKAAQEAAQKAAQKKQGK